MTNLVRVKLENGMEASLPAEHAINSGYKPLNTEAVDTLGNALPATGADEKLIAKRAEQLAALAKKTTAPTPSGDAGANA